MARFMAYCLDIFLQHTFHRKNAQARFASTPSVLPLLQLFFDSWGFNELFFGKVKVHPSIGKICSILCGLENLGYPDRKEDSL